MLKNNDFIYNQLMEYQQIIEKRFMRNKIKEDKKNQYMETIYRWFKKVNSNK